MSQGQGQGQGQGQSLESVILALAEQGLWLGYLRLWKSGEWEVSLEVWTPRGFPIQVARAFGTSAREALAKAGALAESKSWRKAWTRVASGGWTFSWQDVDENWEGPDSERSLGLADLSLADLGLGEED